MISRQITRLAKQAGGSAVDDPELLDLVTGLVEPPYSLLGRFDVSFVQMPSEVLVASIRDHQKYFHIVDEQGALMPCFIAVSNIRSKQPARVRQGNERVLRARLSDARFFWDHDRRTRLDSRVADLENVTFHHRLGSLYDKTLRLEVLAGRLAQHLGLDSSLSSRAALLCKADLTSDMVGEFPRLQGIMGRYYAEHDGERRAVSRAIGEHYLPQQAGDSLPGSRIGRILSLADRIDSLVGLFSAGEEPTGDRDPYALRRAALGVIRLILENGLRINLLPAFCRTMRLYEDKGVVADETPEVIAANLLGFLADRLKVHLREAGVRHDLVSAVFALGDEDDFVRLMARVEALGSFLSNEDGESLLIAYRRAANIVRIESKKY